ncbi:MAG: hypothetical protein JNM07_02875 [Phycisphaerae bacterium]|nr:hypothetical protein [Phycisphaerae bacterium]
MDRDRDIVDIAGLGPRASDGDVAVVRGLARPTPFLRLWFDCAGLYGRAARSVQGDAYTGCCPRCGKKISFPIGPGGTMKRSFRVTCTP